jgi:hypothetical protein
VVVGVVVVVGELTVELPSPPDFSFSPSPVFVVVEVDVEVVRTTSARAIPAIKAANADDAINVDLFMCFLLPINFNKTVNAQA